MHRKYWKTYSALALWLYKSSCRAKIKYSAGINTDLSWKSDSTMETNSRTHTVEAESLHTKKEESAFVVQHWSYVYV